MTTAAEPAPHVLICPDSYKECASSTEAAALMAEAARNAASALPGGAQWAQATFLEFPLADGGEGSLRVVADSSPGFDLVESTVPNAMGDPTGVQLGWNRGQSWAFIESAQALGLGLIPEEDRNIWQAHSFGLGMMITQALDLGANHITLALGGSATNDGGAGMLSALGARFFDRFGRELPPFPGGIASLAAVDLRDLDPRIHQTHFEVALDVDNPLLGPRGASVTFGPQKGAKTEDVAALDGALRRLSRAVLAAQRFAAKSAGEGGTRLSQAEAHGAGAAGGLGWAAMQVLDAAPRSGFTVIAEATNFTAALDSADIVFTGEGRLDGQTLSGKAVMGVVDRCAQADVPTVIFAGSLGPGWERVAGLPNVRVIVTTPEGTAQDNPLDNCQENISRAVYDFVSSQD